jgi:fatty-acyl-CoA synthase
MSSLAKLFDEAAARHPDQTISFPGEDQRLTYSDLAETSRRMAGGLLAAGAREGDAVGILCPNAATFLQGVFAAARIGAAACPLPLPMGLRDLEASAARTQRIVETAGIRHLVTVPKLRPFAEHLTGPQVLDAAALVEQGAATAAVVATPGHRAIVQFTSGSTATPKGVVLTHANVLACAQSITQGIEISASDGWGCWLPLFHDMGLFGTLTGLLNGIPVHVWSPAAFVRSPAAWLTAFVDTGATICAMPNFGYDYLVASVSAERAAELDMAHWRVTFNGAESISVRSVQAFLDRFAPAGFRPETMIPAYGLAEATLVVTLTSLDQPPVYDRVDRATLAVESKAIPAGDRDRDARGIVSLGRPAPGMAVRVAATSKNQLLPDRQVGEIQVRGTAVTSGYLGDHKGLFTVDGWLRTGDLGYLADGELYFTGRSKEMITVRGANVYPLDVEELAQHVPGVYKGRCVAFARTEDAEHEQIVLCAETRLSEEADRRRLIQDIRARCTAELGLPHLTVRLVPPRTIPRTTSGKLQRLGMRDKLAATDAKPGTETTTGADMMETPA